MSEVEWKTVEGYSRYKVSTEGEVMDTKNNVLVAKQLSGIPEYFYVNMTREDNTRGFERVNRLVAKAFIPNPENHPIVDHIDRDKFNNKISNLRWTDHSGNQRNTEGSIFIDGEHILDFVEKYDDPKNAYSYIYRNISEGMDEQEAVQKYEEYLQYGTKRDKVEWDGEEVYLHDLCLSLNKDYSFVKGRLNQGWDIWNAIYDINTEFNSKFSFELCGRNNVGHWFPSREYFGRFHKESLVQYLDSGQLYEDILLVDGKDMIFSDI